MEFTQPSAHAKLPFAINHELKIDPDRLAEILTGIKTHEIRVFDRDFQVGNKLKLNVYDQSANKYTGQMAIVKVTNITAPGSYGLPENIGVMSIELIESLDSRTGADVSDSDANTLDAEQQKIDRAMAALDAMATVWAATFGLRAAVRSIMTRADSEIRLIEFIKHAHAEGLYAGRSSHDPHAELERAQEELVLAMATIESRERNIESILQESSRLQAEISQLNLAEEGAKDAFDAVVNQKRELEVICKKKQLNIISLNDDFRKVLTERNDLHAMLVKVDNQCQQGHAAVSLDAEIHALITKCSQITSTALKI